MWKIIKFRKQQEKYKITLRKIQNYEKITKKLKLKNATKTDT